MAPPWHYGRSISPTQLYSVRESMIFDHCKWDPQTGDTAVLCPAPLILERAAADEIARLAEAMSVEILAAERAIVASPSALSELGLPGSLRRALGAVGKETTHATTLSADSASVRVMRFDFHATTEGWRVSEVNSDVPGGYIESKGLAELMATLHPGLAPLGDPVQALVRALPPGARVGLVHATAYTDDRQVMVYLAKHLAATGRDSRLLAPDQVRWHEGVAHTCEGEPLDSIFRFYPAEWLPNLGWRSGWRGFTRASKTPQCNPPTALCSQSKRFPLACAHLNLQLPVWSTLTPETRDPRALPASATEEWVLKPALGRVGDGIGIAGVTDAADHQKITRAARRHPAHWAAQRRFHALPWETDTGPRYPCIGIYVINGTAAGAYGRVASRPLIDARAQDVAVLYPPAPRSPLLPLPPFATPASTRAPSPNLP